MTIITFKNPTNIYRIDAKKLGGGRGYLPLEDLRIKSRFSRFNMPIHEVGREKTREGGERRGRTLGQEGWARVKCRELGAIHYGVELGVRVTGAELTAMSSTVPRSSASEMLMPRRVNSAPS